MRLKTKLLFAGITVFAVVAADTACSTQFDVKPCSTDADCAGSGFTCVQSGAQSYCGTRTDAGVEAGPAACTTDNECPAEQACNFATPNAVCVPGSTIPINVGQSAPSSGPNQDLGLEMKRGVELAFKEATDAGGIHGRPIAMKFIDDQYTPTQAEQNARALTDAKAGTGAPHCPTTMTPPAGGDPFSLTALDPGPNAVTAVIGSVGTPTMVRSAPIVVETGRLYFGAFTGAGAMLRDDKAGACKRLIFNVRASYGQEARATLEYFTKLNVTADDHIFSFDQKDTFGDAGFNGLNAAWTATHSGAMAKFQRFQYVRDDTNSVDAQITATIAAIKTLLGPTPATSQTFAIMMTDTYGPGARYIKGLRDWQFGTDGSDKVQFVFSNVSFVGPNSLASRLKELGTVPGSNPAIPYTQDVYVSQVMPNYSKENSDAVIAYRKAIGTTGVAPTYTSFEGYVVGRIFVEGLRANKQAFTPDNLVTAFESLATLQLGLGGFIGFSPSSHQASKSVWGTGIQPDGSFSDKYFWSDGNDIQLAQ